MLPNFQSTIYFQYQSTFNIWPDLRDVGHRADDVEVTWQLRYKCGLVRARARVRDRAGFRVRVRTRVGARARVRARVRVSVAASV